MRQILNAIYPIAKKKMKDKLNLETGQISWPELARHFARGVVIIVDKNLDLLDVAAQLADDNKTQIESLIEQKHLVRATDEHAIHWQQHDPLFWAVVIAPWVLVQEITGGD